MVNSMYHIKFMRLLITLAFFFLAHSHSFSQWSIIRTDADSLIRVGTDYIYNLQFDKASGCFKDVIEKYPDNPAGYFLDAMVEWWKISIYRNTDKYNSIFLKKIEKIIKVCDKLLEKNKYDIGGLFFKGGALGYRGRFFAQDKSWFKAAIDGKSAYDIFLRCQEIAPDNQDILLGTGIINYFTVAFPEKYPSVRPLVAFLPRGDKKIGMLQLESASQFARYASTEAKVVLLQIYYQFEHNYSKTLKVSKSLFDKYPNNPYFHKYLGRSYVTTGHLNKWDKTWRNVLRRYIKKMPGYDKMIAREALYYIGSAASRKQNFKTAIKYYKKCVEASRVIDKDEDSGFQVKAALRVGKLYDRLKNRKQAVKYYKLVLSLDEYDNSHKDAEKYLKSPYK